MRKDRAAVANVKQFFDSEASSEFFAELGKLAGRVANAGLRISDPDAASVNKISKHIVKLITSETLNISPGQADARSQRYLKSSIEHQSKRLTAIFILLDAARQLHLHLRESEGHRVSDKVEGGMKPAASSGSHDLAHDAGDFPTNIATSNEGLPCLGGSDVADPPAVCIPGSGEVQFLDRSPATSPFQAEDGKFWHYDVGDGLWHDRTATQWSEQAAQAERDFFSKYDDPDAPVVNNVVPLECRGYPGPGADIAALIALAKVLLGPYCFFTFTAEAEPYRQATELVSNFEAVVQLEKRTYVEDLRACVPDDLTDSRPVLRLSQNLDFGSQQSWMAAPPIVSSLPPSRAKARDKLGCVTSDEQSEPVYTAACARIRARRPDLPENHQFNFFNDVLSAGLSAVLSGPNGSGKTTAYRRIRKQFTESGTFFVEMHSVDQKSYFDNSNIGSALGKLDKLKNNNLNERIVLLVDEYGELDSHDLSQLGEFDQIVFFGDYAQTDAIKIPIFDFIRRCGGSSYYSPNIFRSKVRDTFAIISALAYGSRFRVVPGPGSIGSSYRPLRVAWCPEDPEVEVVAMWCIAQRHLLDGYKVIIVVDGEVAKAAAHVVIDEKTRSQYRNFLQIKGSHEIRGLECHAIIVAAAALDRAKLSLRELLIRLIVILGRPLTRVEILLPDKPTLGKANERPFSCLLSPVLSYRPPPHRRHIPEYPGFVDALRRRGFQLHDVEGLLIVSDPPFRALLSIDERPSPEAKTMWHRFVANFSERLLHLHARELENDKDFVKLISDLRKLKTLPPIP